MLEVLHQNALLVGASVGLGFGILLQKGRFCFVSAFRDFIAYKDGRVLKGVIIAILAMMLGVNLAYALGAPAEHFWVPRFGLNSIIGGFIFGLGMTWAGGCATGSLYRAGEGYLHFWLVLFGTGMGYIIFASLFESVFLPYYYLPLQVFSGFSPFKALPPGQALILATGVVAFGSVAYLVRNRGLPHYRILARLTLKGDDQPKTSFVARMKAPWDAKLCGLGIGLLASVWFVVWSTFSVTGPEAKWVGYLYGLVVGEKAIASNTYWTNVVLAGQGLQISVDMVMLASLIAGSFIAALWSGDFRLRSLPAKRIPNALMGGLLMGFGSRMAPGCNISNTFSGLAILSIPGAVATLGLVLGVYVATHYMFRDVGCAL